MRCAVVLLALAAFGAARVPSQQPKVTQRAADQDLLKKQQDCIQLLQQITQEIPNEQLQILGTTYDIQNNYQQYENPILVQYYVGAVQSGLVQPKGTTYSNSISQLRKEVSLLHRILLGAKDYQTFLNTAAWARTHVNEHQFVKAFIGAVLLRPDTQDIILPPLYEIVPQYYFDARIIQEAQDIAMQQQQGHGPHVGQNNVVIPVNYSSYLSDSEHQLSYFTQDIGLANYYGYMNLAGYLLQQRQQQAPVQSQQQRVVQNQESQIGQGSRYYYLHQQLLAHYELNRLGNGLGPIQNTDYVHVNAPYQPHLRYTNGLEFPGRPETLQLSPVKDNLIKYVNTLIQRVIDTIDKGYVITPQGAFLSLYQPQGLNILGELIEGTGRSINPRYYGSLQAAARQLLGNAPEVQNIYDYTPSVLELGQIAVRDPAFYQLNKQVLKLFDRYQSSLPAYQYSDLLLPGVTIQSVDTTPLVTLFHDYYVNLNAATVQQQTSQKQQQGKQQQQITAQLQRLDHKPYTYQISVQSENNVPGAVVRVYMGPKHDHQGKPISISQHRHQFVELDQFITNLQQGLNIISRNSQQTPSQSFDYPSVQEIQNRINDAVRSQEPFYVTEPHQIFSMPARLTLPKGRPEGYPLQLLVLISQPEQQNVGYGPTIPEQVHTYQQNEYQVIGTEKYQQIQHQGGNVVGVKQTVEVVPENLLNCQQGSQVLRNHYANLYTQQHGQYPYTHSQYQVGQGQGQNVHVQEQQQALQHQQQGQQKQQQHIQGQQGQQQYQQGNVGDTGTQGIQNAPLGVQNAPLGVQNAPLGVQNAQLGVQNAPLGVQQGVQDAQQGVPQGIQGVSGLQGGVQEIQGNIHHTTYQGQNQQAQRLGIRYNGSGLYHAGGYQNILGQKKDEKVSEYYQNKHISEIIGGAISLDGRPLGYPLERPLTPGALCVPNVHIRTVYVYHEGQPTNEVYNQ